MNGFPEISGYRIERELGTGGMATVYLAVQENLNRQVAIKVLSPVLLADKQFIQRFLQEAETAANLHHSNIVPIHDIGRSDNFNYIVMEYLEESLKDRIKQGPIGPKVALDIVNQMARALDYAHAEGFVHRDIKPENIMFRRDGTPVLTDFGIARAMDSATKLTKTGISIGTPYYMSPEQARGEKLDGRADIYSLGVVFYEMLTGSVPFDAENTVAIVLKHIQEPIPRLPPHLTLYQPLIDSMMAKERDARARSEVELIGLIEALKGGIPGPRPTCQGTPNAASARTGGAKRPSEDIGLDRSFERRGGTGQSRPGVGKQDKQQKSSSKSLIIGGLSLLLMAAVIALAIILSRPEEIVEEQQVTLPPQTDQKKEKILVAPSTEKDIGNKQQTSTEVRREQQFRETKREAVDRQKIGPGPEESLVIRFFQAMEIKDVPTMSSMALEPLTMGISGFNIISVSPERIEPAGLAEMDANEAKLRKKLEDHVGPTIDAKDALDVARNTLDNLQQKYERSKRLFNNNLVSFEQNAATETAKQAGQARADAAKDKYDQEFALHKDLQKRYNDAKAAAAREEEITAFSLGVRNLASIRELTGMVHSKNVLVETEDKAGQAQNYGFYLRRYDLKDEAANVAHRGRWVILRIKAESASTTQYNEDRSTWIRTPEEDDAPVRAIGEIKSPKIIKQVDPVYPEIARQASVEGVVIIEATTDIYGRVRGIKILRSIPLLDQAAIDAVTQWVYEPIIIDGRPRGVVFTVTVRFQLK